MNQKWGQFFFACPSHSAMISFPSQSSCSVGSRPADCHSCLVEDRPNETSHKFLLFQEERIRESLEEIIHVRCPHPPRAPRNHHGLCPFAAAERACCSHCVSSISFCRGSTDSWTVPKDLSAELGARWAGAHPHP